MKINLIRLANSIDPKVPYLKDSEAFIEDLNNELFEYGHELVNNEKSAQFSIIFVETGGSEQKFIKIYKKLKEPIILMSNSMNNSLPAMFEIKTFLSEKKISHTLLMGNEKTIASSIDKISNMYSMIGNMKGANLGVIGKPSDWLIASKVDYKTVKDKFDVNLIDIDMEELYNEIEVAKIDKVPHSKELKEKWKDESVLNTSLKIYSALKAIVKKYNLKGITVRCFDLIGKYKNTACLAFALLNQEGIISTCEGDIPTLLTMYLIKVATNQPCFQANPSKIMVEEEEAIFSHCTVPLNMCSKFSLDTHFESGLGIGVKGELQNKDVTIVKIPPNLKDILLVTGKIVENTSYKNYCRTQIKVKLEEAELIELVRHSFGNHVCVVYGDIISDLIPFLQLYKLIPENL